MSHSILICSSEELTREGLKNALASTFPLIVVEDSEQCLAALRQKAAIALVFIGTSADDTETSLFEEIRQMSSQLPVIAVGENGVEEPAVEAVRQGATGYTMLPLRAKDILAIAQKAIPA